MKQFFLNLLSQDSKLSSTRFCMIASLFFSFIIALLGIFLNKDLEGISILIAMFIGPSMSAKVLQKKTEVNTPALPNAGQSLKSAE